MIVIYDRFRLKSIKYLRVKTALLGGELQILAKNLFTPGPRNRSKKKKITDHSPVPVVNIRGLRIKKGGKRPGPNGTKHQVHCR